MGQDRSSFACCLRRDYGYYFCSSLSGIQGSYGILFLAVVTYKPIARGCVVFGLFKNGIFGRSRSKGEAKNRLEMVLVQDRSGLSANDMEVFQKEILSVITKFFVLEKKGLEIEWKRADGSTALVINTPIHGRPKVVNKKKKKKAAA